MGMKQKSTSVLPLVLFCFSMPDDGSLQH